MKNKDVDYKGLLLSLIGGMGLCDHLGDVADDVAFVLKKLGEPYSKLEWDELSELSAEMGKIGVKTLYGTDLYDPEDELVDDEEQE